MNRNEKTERLAAEIALYNMLLAETMFELLAEIGILPGQKIKERIEKIRKEIRKEAPSSDDSYNDISLFSQIEAGEPLNVLERRAIFKALNAARGNAAAAARMLGIGKTTLYRKLKQYQPPLPGEMASGRTN